MDLLSVSKCRDLLGQTKLNDKQVEELRDALYVFVENILDDYYANIKNKCKEQ